MTDVVVSSYRPGGASKGGEIPLEEVKFNYGKIEWTYTETDHKTGQAKGDVKANWDITANKGG